MCQTEDGDECPRLFFSGGSDEGTLIRRILASLPIDLLYPVLDRLVDDAKTINRRCCFSEYDRSCEDLKLELYVDRERRSNYSILMKWVSLVLLSVMVLTVLAPLSSFSLIAVREGQPLLSNLDVCNSTAPALSTNGEMPCMVLCPFSTVPILSITAHEPAHPRFTELIITAPNEHPPKA
jgi:hypothetical protein